jgi:hypothetical protein
LDVAELRSELAGRALVARPDGNELAPQSRAEHPVVTAVGVEVGGQLAAGSLLCEISGEPVVVLAGAFGPYRDLAVGDKGPDVDMLRAAVGAAGYRDGRPGVLDLALMQGLQAFYRDLGYELPTRVPEASAGSGGSGQAPSDSAETETTQPVPEPFLPREWWLTAPLLPAPVTEVTLRVGAEPGEYGLGAVTISTAAPLLEVVLPTALGEAVLDGVELRFEPSGLDPVECIAGAVSLNEDNAGNSTTALLVPCAGNELADLKTGTAGRVVFVLAQADESLVVPVTAIFKAATGGAALRLAGSDGELVPVELGYEVDGMVQVSGEGLEVGTLVVLGRS